MSSAFESLPSAFEQSDDEQDIDRGILGNFIHSTIRDVKGAARVAGAALLSPAAILGANVPITFEDLDSRDLRGALMLAALGAGGIAGKAAEALPFVARLGGSTSLLGRAAAAGTSELVAGAAFGLVRPLDEDESRLGAIGSDAALFGLFGAGLSFMKSAVKATVGQYLTRLKTQARAANTAIAAMSVQEEQIAKELAGIRLLNPDNNTSIGIRRMKNGRITITRYNEQNRVASTEQVRDMNSALAKAFEEGFRQDIGPFRPKLLSSMDELDQATLDLFAQGNLPNITAELGGIRLTEYRAVQEAARAGAERDAHLAALAAELVSEQIALLGTIKLIDSTRQMIAAQLSLKPNELARLSDADLLRAGILKGIATIDNLESGVKTREYLKELFLNDALPDGVTYTVNHNADVFGASILTPRTIAKLHPEIAPIVSLAQEGLIKYEKGSEPIRDLIFYLRTAIPKEKVEVGVNIIEASAAKAEAEIALLPEAVRAAQNPIAYARQIALKDATATGDAHVIDFVQRVTERLAEQRLRLVSAGRMEAGRAGYFPIVNIGQWKLDVQGAVKTEFKGFHETKEAALAEARRLLAENPTARAFVVPHAFTWDTAAGTFVNGKQFGLLVKAIQEAEGITLTPAEARKALEAQVTITADAPLKYSPFTKARRLGLRDFSKDPIEALEIYLYNTERVLALNDFERQAVKIVETIPQAKPRLKAWAEQYIADVLGRPRPIEQTVDAALKAAGIDVAPRALKRYSSALRRWETFSRLGGFWSPIINMSQIAINTFPVLGAKWAAKGLSVLTSPKRLAEAKRLLAEHGLDLGAYIPLTHEGNLVGAETIRGALKEGKYVNAVERIWLFGFNQAEKLNRIVTAWGAYQKALSEGHTAKGAVEVARKVVERTQFSYRVSDMPELLRGPVGALLGQFKSFFINELEFVASLNKQEALRFAAALHTIGGLAVFTNLPGTDFLNAASGIFFDKKANEALKTAPGENPLARYTIFGVPGLIGIDVSDYIGIGALQNVFQGVFGPTIADANNIFTLAKDAVGDIAAYGDIQNDTLNAFFEKSLPSGIRRMLRGYEIVATGEVRNPYTHKLIYRPQDRLRVAAATAFGAPAIELQQERIMDAITQRVRDRYVKARNGYGKEAALFLLQGREEDANRVLAEARAAGIFIDGLSLRTYMRELQRPGGERRRRMTPKALRAEMATLFETTGTITPETAG